MTPHEFEALPDGAIVCAEHFDPDRNRPALFALRRPTGRPAPKGCREAHALTGSERGGVRLFLPRSADLLRVWSPLRRTHVTLMQESVFPRKYTGPASDFAIAARDAALVGVDLRRAWLAAKEADEPGLSSAPEAIADATETPPENPPAPGMSEIAEPLPPTETGSIDDVVQALRDAETERAAAEDRMHDALQTRARRLMSDLQALQPHYPRPIAVTVTPRDFTISFGTDE